MLCIGLRIDALLIAKYSRGFAFSCIACCLRFTSIRRVFIAIIIALLAFACSLAAIRIFCAGRRWIAAIFIVD